MSFMQDINRIKLSKVEQTIKECLKSGYNCHIVMNGEMYLIDTEVL